MKPGTLFVLMIILLPACALCGCSGPSGREPVSTATSASQGIPGIPHGPSHLVFYDSRGNVERPITVYLYRPAAWNESGPIVMVMAGADRNGEAIRDIWIPIAERYSCLIVSPEFSNQYYPGDNMYIGGNMYDLHGSLNPESNWTYSAVEHLFDDIKGMTGGKQTTYLLWGHSAGGQFVHRMVTFLPNARYSRAVAANAGVYDLPVFSIPYNEMGLGNSPLPRQELPVVFGRKLIVMSGEADTNPNDSALANFPAAEAQGKTRFERALFYYKTAQAEAGRLNVPLNWEYHPVPGVGHDSWGMANASVPFMFA